MSAMRKVKEEPLPAPREVLAVAIAEHNHAVEREQKAHAATENARSIVFEAKRKLNLATEAANDARSDRTAKLIREASGGEQPAHDRFIRQARVKESEAQDELDAANDALAAIKRTASEWTVEVKRTGEWLEKCIDVVLSTDHVRLLAEAEALQAELVDRRIGLQWLYRFMDSRSAEAKAIDEFLFKIDERHIPGIVQTTAYGWRNHPANETWKAAREALMVDADATLPVK